MDIERRTPANTAIVLIDYVTGFANMLRSQTVAENLAGAVAMAKIARGYDVPLVVTVGPRIDPRGPLYPQVSAVIGDHPVIYRGGEFDSFDVPEFEEAVAATGRRHLVVAGITTEGCVINTVIGALRRDYTASIVVDASGGCSPTSHDTAIKRLIQLGVTPTSWLSFAAELQRSYGNGATLPAYLDVQAQSPEFVMNRHTLAAKGS